MNRLLTSLHVALILTVVLPVFSLGTWNWKMGWSEEDPGGNRPACAYYYTPLGEGIRVLRRAPHLNYFLPSVVAAGLPGVLALLNLPLLIRLQGATAQRWRAYSSLVLGLLSTSLLSQLQERYGDSRTYGGWVIWSLSLLLCIAGTAAIARLGRDAAPLPVIRDS